MTSEKNGIFSFRQRVRKNRGIRSAGNRLFRGRFCSPGLQREVVRCGIIEESDGGSRSAVRKEAEEIGKRIVVFIAMMMMVARDGAGFLVGVMMRNDVVPQHDGIRQPDPEQNETFVTHRNKGRAFHLFNSSGGCRNLKHPQQPRTAQLCDW